MYISADVETDGPIPGEFSLLSFGLCVVGTWDGQALGRPTDRGTFYREVRPISDRFEQEALDVNGLNRAELLRTGADPGLAMSDASEWVLEVSGEGRPVLVAYPVAFDWSFLHWYFVRYGTSGSPFGFSSCVDIRTYFMALAGTPADLSGKASMPAHLLPSAPHTHNALDDAVEQGDLFANLVEWGARRRRGVA